MIGGIGKIFGSFGKMMGGGGGGPLEMIGGLLGGGGAANPLGMITSMFGGGGGGPLGMIGGLLGGLGGAGGAGGGMPNIANLLNVDAFGGGPGAFGLFGANGGEPVAANEGAQQASALQGMARGDGFPPGYFKSAFEEAAPQAQAQARAPIVAPAHVGAAPRAAPVGRNNAATNEILSRAARAAGVPESWANSPALARLIQKESGGRVDAKNPNSTAFGMFQFLKGTWKEYLPEVPYGSKDAHWQAVGGLRYIQQRYGTPERALAFHHKNNWY